MPFRRIFPYLFPVSLLAGVLCLAPSPAAAAWYNSAWRYANPVTVDNTANNDVLTNYPVRLALTSSSIDFSKAQQSGEDIRVTASDGTTLLNHWIESYSSSSQTASIYVRIPTLPAATSTGLYVYYGNGSATSTSNFGDTFSPTNYEDAFPQAAVSPGIQYDAFPSAERLQNGNILVAYTTGSAHGSTDQIVKLARSTDNGQSWSISTIFDYTSSATSTATNVGMKQLSNGTILLPITKTSSGVGTQWISKSTDNGLTWSSPIYIASIDSFFVSNTSQHYGKIVELSNGRLLMPVYGQAAGGNTTWSSTIFESSDGGDTWTYKSTIVYDGVNNWSETAIVNIDDNNIIAVVRKNIGSVFATLSKFTSSDGGATWSAPVNHFTSATYNTYGVSPDLIKLANGHILLTFGNRYYGPTFQPSQRPHGIFSYISTDNGATWGKEVPIFQGKYFDAPANGDIGYPSSIQLADGTIKTFYYHALAYAVSNVRVDETTWTEGADFTFTDDLELGNSNRWSTVGKVTDVATNIKRDGSYSMKLIDQDTQVLNAIFAKLFGIVRAQSRITFWVYPTTEFSVELYDGELSGTNDSAFLFSLINLSGGTGEFVYYNGSAYASFPTPATLTINQWTKLSLKIDSNTSQAELFVNDVSYGNATRYIAGNSIDWFSISSQSTAGQGNTVYTDDVFAQPFAATEPSLTLSALLKEPTPPSGSLSIDGGAASTTAGQVALSVSASDNFDATSSIQMQVSENSDFKDAVWQVYGTSLTHSLQAVPGTRTIYVRFKDADGNVSSAATDSITYNLFITGVGSAPSAPNPAPTIPNPPSVPVAPSPVPAPAPLPPASPSVPPAERIAELKASLLVLMVQARQRGLTLPEGIGTLVGSSFTRDLSLRSRGEDVKLMQSVLIEAKTGPAGQRLSKTGATGFFGSLTYAALKEYQQEVGISPTGYFGPKTRGAWGF